MVGKCLRSAAGLGLALLALGCGGNRWSMNDTVEGTITLDGTPLGTVFVQFVPDVDPTARQGPSSSAYTDEQGHFRLMCDNKMPGAVIGRHNVMVLAGRGSTRKVAIPSAYSLASTTPLQVEVKADRHTYDLNLTRNAQPRR